MNKARRKLLSLIIPNGFGNITLSELGKKVGIKNKQLTKYHLDKLVDEGHVTVKTAKGLITAIYPNFNNSVIAKIPIYGSVNCGPATLLAENNLEGYLSVSKKLLKNMDENYFALLASGDSMNQASINKKRIEDGDYVIVDPQNKVPKNNEYVVSILNGAANIKKFIRKENKIILKSESSCPFKYPPCHIHPDDDYLINGVVVDVIKS